MMSEFYKGVFFIVFGVIFISTCFSWLCFARLTMARIERDMEREGLALPRWDRRAGFRVGFYASTILLRHKPGKMPLVNAEAIQRLATRKDWYLALWFWVSGAVFLLCGVIFEIFRTQ